MSSFQQFCEALYPYVSRPEFMGLVSGVFASYLYDFIKAVVPAMTPKLTFVFNVVLAAVPFAALALILGKNGITPDGFYAGLVTAGLASQATYRLLLKKEADGSIQDINWGTPAVSHAPDGPKDATPDA